MVVFLSAILGAIVAGCVVIFFTLYVFNVKSDKKIMRLVVIFGIIGCIAGGIVGNVMSRWFGLSSPTYSAQASHKGEKQCGYCKVWYSDSENKHSISMYHLCVSCESNREWGEQVKKDASKYK